MSPMSLKLPFRTYLYFLSQSVNLTTAVMSVAMAAIVGASLAPNLWLSTVPYGFQFLFVTLMTVPASRIMKAIGRKKSFLLATIPLAVSGISGFIALETRSFWLLMVSHSLLGIYIAFANFNRFAATDGLNPMLQPRAISLVVAGGILAAVTGPVLADGLKDIPGFNAFAICYASLTGLAILSFVIHVSIKEPPKVTAPEHAAKAKSGGGWRSIRQSPRAMLAVFVASAGYGIMNLLMIQASLQMSAMNVHFSAISSAIQWHVVAMFAPSFFTGTIINRVGLRRVIMLGVSLLIISGVANLLAGSATGLVVALIILGLGWNLTYVGGSSLLAKALDGSPHMVEAQGVNDLWIAIMATAGAFSPSILQEWLGWFGTNILCIGICLMLLIYTICILQQDRSLKTEGNPLR